MICLLTIMPSPSFLCLPAALKRMLHNTRGRKTNFYDRALSFKDTAPWAWFLRNQNILLQCTAHGSITLANDIGHCFAAAAGCMVGCPGTLKLPVSNFTTGTHYGVEGRERARALRLHLRCTRGGRVIKSLKLTLLSPIKLSPSGLPRAIRHQSRWKEKAGRSGCGSRRAQYVRY